jgi:hypothetical protein
VAQPVALKAIARRVAHALTTSACADERFGRRTLYPLLVTSDPVPPHVIDAIIFDLDNCLAPANEIGAAMLEPMFTVIADLSELQRYFGDALDTCKQARPRPHWMSRLDRCGQVIVEARLAIQCVEPHVSKGWKA